MVGVFCYDMTGKLVWSKDLGAYRMFANWGTSSSPTFDGQRLFIQCDNDERSFVVALDKLTGQELWRADRAERSTWSSPVVWHNNVRTELVLMGAKRIRSYEPATGKVLWELATQQDSGAGRARPGGGKPAAGGCKSTPVATSEMIYVGMASKVQGQSLGPMWAVRAGASGEISLRDDETSNAHIAWFRADAGPHFASAVVYDGLLYVFSPHRGMLHCFDAQNGANVYEQRLSGAGDFKSSPWAYDGKVFNVDENGTTFVIRSGREFQLIGKNEIRELCWSSPAIARGTVFLRGVDYLYGIQLPSVNGDRK
jgi:outer membrane protein assembly factor BamB